MLKKSLLVVLTMVSSNCFKADCIPSSLHTACQGYNPVMVKYSIEYGADLNEVNWSSQTPLMYVCTFVYYQKLALNYANQLISAGANINYQNRQGDTALHIACKGSNNHLVFLLLNNGANFYIKNYKGQTALHIACKHGQREHIEYLLAFGANVNARDNKGRTALHIVSELGNKLLVELLLQHGADAKIIDKNGNTAADICCAIPQEKVSTIKSEILGLLSCYS